MMHLGLHLFLWEMSSITQGLRELVAWREKSKGGTPRRLDQGELPM